MVALLRDAFTVTRDFIVNLRRDELARFTQRLLDVWGLKKKVKWEMV